jgi:hypothetical protein
MLLFGAVSTHADQHVTFSATKHGRERKIVKTLLKEEIKEARTLSKGPVQIDIALADLDHDGTREIMAYVRQYPYFCGADGCWFMVFRQEGRTWRNILHLIIREDVSLSTSSTSGFVDLVVEDKSVWSWQGDKYDFSNRLP